MDQGTREIVESLQHAFKDLGEDVADLVEALDEHDKKLAEILRTMQTIAGQTTELTQRLNQYLDTAAKEDGRVRQRLSALEERVA